MITIQKADIEDAVLIAQIHLLAFKNFFLSSLGKDFLKFYYTCFIKNKGAVVLIAKDNDRIVGFAAATALCKGFNTALIKQNLFSFLLVGLKLFVTNPKALVRLARNMTKKSDEVQSEEDYAELYSIGVAPEGQGKGVGKELLSRMEQELLKRKVDKLSLTTDYYDNDRTIGFYKAMGYGVLYVFTAYPERKMYRMIKKLK